MTAVSIGEITAQITDKYRERPVVVGCREMQLVGVDIGGTFTDLITYGIGSDDITVGKVPSTPDDPSVGLLNGLEEVAVDPSAIEMLLHGTTVATNATLERDGARAGLITTKGTQDTLELGWRSRPEIWGLEGEYEPIIPRNRCLGVPERTTADGAVLDPIDEDAVREAGRELLKRDVEAVAVSFLHSYANPENEIRAVEVLEEFWPNEYVVRSSDVLPEFREFERTSTTALTSYTQPVIASYLTRLEEKLEENGFANEILLMQSNGGIASSNVSKRRSAHTMLSGPAAGATAAARIAAVTGYEDVISCDMGGTSFDVALLPDGEPVKTQETDLDYQLPLRLPMTDITTIGAGGGSIATVDEGGILQAGPESAGADPGPVCYGMGGTDITITDANLVLGRINPENPIGENLSLDLEHTREVMQREIGDRLDLTTEQAANAVIEVAVDKMIGQIRELSINQGYDPRNFTLVTFGGAGPLHAGELITKSDVPRVIVPYYPGILSAIGCLLADIRYDNVQSVNETIEGADLDAYHQTIAELEAAGRDLLAASDSTVEAVSVRYESDMLYSGQTHTVTVELPSETPSQSELREHFRDVYLEKYSEEVDKPILIDNVKVTVVGETRDIDLAQLVTDTATSLEAARVTERRINFDDTWYDCPIYDREKLPLGASFSGPCVVEQADTTTVVNPGLRAEVDGYGNIIITVDD